VKTPEIKNQCLLAEFNQLSEDNRKDGDSISQWRFSMLPFSVALYSFAIKVGNPYISLFGLLMSSIAIDQCMRRLRDMIKRECYIMVFIESEMPFLRWQRVKDFDLFLNKKTPKYTSVFYFSCLGLVGLIISGLFWEKFRYGWQEFLFLGLFTLGILFWETRKYIYMPLIKKELVENYQKKKRTMMSK
jgi:hypothetical protein